MYGIIFTLVLIQFLPFIFIASAIVGIINGILKRL